MEPKPRRKKRSVDALTKCDHEPYVLLAVARFVNTYINQIYTRARLMGLRFCPQKFDPIGGIS